MKRSVACGLSSIGGLHFCEPRILFSRRSRRHSSGRCSAEKIGGWIHALRFIRSCIRLIVSCDLRCCNRLGRGGSGFNSRRRCGDRGFLLELVFKSGRAFFCRCIYRSFRSKSIFGRAHTISQTSVDVAQVDYLRRKDRVYAALNTIFELLFGDAKLSKSLYKTFDALSRHVNVCSLSCFALLKSRLCHISGDN